MSGDNGKFIYTSYTSTGSIEAGVSVKTGIVQLQIRFTGSRIALTRYNVLFVSSDPPAELRVDIDSVAKPHAPMYTNIKQCGRRLQFMSMNASGEIRNVQTKLFAR